MENQASDPRPAQTPCPEERLARPLFEDWSQDSSAVARSEADTPCWPMRWRRGPFRKATGAPSIPMPSGSNC